MSRDELINTTRAILAKAGFNISPVMSLRSVCFDVVGKRGDTLLIIKVLSNIDAFSRENAEEIKVLAETLEACPLLIGERSSSGILEPGIVYSRFNIQIISNETLADYILGESPPFISAAPGGLYVKLDNNMLRSIREQENISLGTLADIAGVSRKAIQMYEAGMNAMIDVALKLEEYLNAELIKPVDPFTYSKENLQLKRELTSAQSNDTSVINHLLEMGFSVTPVERSPFEALTRNKDVVIITGVGDDESLIEKARIASKISEIVGRHSVVIVERKHGMTNVDRTAIVTKEELNKMDDKNELTDVVMERGSSQ